jgi:hypothetical protein
MGALASLVDVEMVTGQTTAEADEARVTYLLDAASDVVRAYVGQTFELVVDDVVELYPADAVLRLPQLPVTDIGGITIDGVTIAADAYRWSHYGIVVPSTTSVFGAWPWSTGTPLVVTYSHGFATPPPWLAAIVATMVAAAVVSTPDSLVYTSLTAGSTAEVFRDRGAGMVIPRSARTLLARAFGRAAAGTWTLPLR